jgi:CRISPR-associated protein Cas5h
VKVIVFDIWGDYGHFKKFHTTASPLTFSFPPPTAVIGIVAAILGIDKENYWDTFSHDNTRLADIIIPLKSVFNPAASLLSASTKVEYSKAVIK